MRNLFLLVAAMLTGVFASCEKNDVDTIVQDVQTVDVAVSPVVENSLKLCGIERPESVPIYVADMTITATSAAGVVSDSYEFSSTSGAEPGNIVLEKVYVGYNTFDATANPYDPADFSGVGGIGFEGVGVGLMADSERENVVASLRAMHPWAIFTGSTSKNVFYEMNEEGEVYDEQVFIEMTTDNGRLVVTYEFEDSPGEPLLDKYWASASFMTDNVGTWASIDLTRTNPEGWNYFSSSIAVEGYTPVTTLTLFEKEGDNIPLRTINLHEEFPEEFTVTGGIDRYVRVIITDDWVKIDVTNFVFDFQWDEVDEDVIL